MQDSQKSKPVAVVISDIHFNINTLEVASAVLNLAVDKTLELDVPLIICGDLHDTKASLRGECVKAIMDTLRGCRYQPIILRGNHDSINEKSSDHALEFLSDLAFIVDAEATQYSMEFEDEIVLGWFIPYQHDISQFKIQLDRVPKGSTLFMHQGVQDSSAGHYIQDKSAIPKKWLSGLRVISGHYHTRQTIELPDGGRLDYVGNPYTLGFGEAKDPQKGFQVLYDDGSLEFIPTNLRRHVVFDVTLEGEGFVTTLQCPEENDIVWVKLKGPSDKLPLWTKEILAERLMIKGSFKLDLIPTDTRSELVQQAVDLPQNIILDNLIENLSNTDISRKLRLKDLWKQFT